MPTVSVIMPVYNGARFLEESINSVLMQTYRDLEYIIINDSSTDMTVNILEYYAKIDDRIKIITNAFNIGIAKSLNIGLKVSKGYYIARIDADDIWDSKKLEIQIKYIKRNPAINLLGTSVLYINEEGNVLNKENKKTKMFFSHNKIKRDLLKYNLFCHSSVIFNRLVIDMIGCYNETFSNAEDYEFWLRIIAKFKAEILPDQLVRYRIHSHMKSLQKRSEQIKYVIKAKFYGFRIIHFKVIYIIYLVKDIFLLLIPDWSIRLKKKLFF